MIVILKDPDAILNYSVSWARWLDSGDEILTSTWVVEANADGLKEDSSSKTATKATVILSGGAAGNDYTITNRITTKNGLQDDRSFTLRVQER